jgi:hypothetical protein
LETLSKTQSLIVDKQPPPDIVGKKPGDVNPKDAGPNVTKSPWNSKL